MTLTLGCSREQASPAPAAAAPQKPAAPLPTSAQAKTIIEGSPEFPDFQFTYASWSVPLKKEALNPATKKTVEELRSGGWLGFDGDGNVVLSQKARNDKRFLVRSNDTLDVVPLAKKELLAVTSVAPKGDQSTADFDWKWVPNEVGALLKSGLVAQQYAATHHARATLMFADGKWSVLLIEEKP